MTSFTLDQLGELSKEVLNKASGKVLLFYGEMGVGKTTLIKEMVKQLGSSDQSSSPTFSLVNEYRTHKNEPLYHFDFYRINDESEALDMGVDEYLYSGRWCFIEWPEKVKNLLPLNAVAIHLTKNSDGSRSITIK